MRYLIVARHGDYHGKLLTDNGIADVKALAKSIPIDFENVPARIISSTALRAKRSAGIISNSVDVFDIEFVPYLWSGEDNPQEVMGAYFQGLPSSANALIELVERKGDGIEALVVVSHKEVCEDLPRFFAEKHGIEYKPKEIKKGHGVFLDLQQKTYIFLP